MKDDIANRKAYAAAEKAREKVRKRRTGLHDRRRVVHTVPATGSTSKTASAKSRGTIFPNRVTEPEIGMDVLMDGANNCKIGGDVLVGRLKGAKILTLSLEERRTCPRTCLHWTTCYGNSMHWAKRWQHGPKLELAIRDQVTRHFDQKRPSNLLVRLHVLGDFYSMEYLSFWIDLLAEFPGLHVFGFTAWGRDTEIGDHIAWARDNLDGRFAVRTSGEIGPMGSWTIDWPTEKRFVTVNGQPGMVCPEQRDANDTGKRGKHCGNCAACWQSDVAVVFIEH